jgi:hypothetical protein
MRLTPAQIGIRLICGETLPWNHAQNDSLPVRIGRGHDFLVKITGEDFGYDLLGWHNHLKVTRQGGYAYGRNIALPRIMKAALESSEWQEATRTLTCNDAEAAGGKS